ncbi:D-alanine--D-alanine ligase family protein [Tomitella fengzijianii]|uniref:D-alanine--D-alanine ligase n=1 Tax=Tomitella fengzijianii TaxID=2597660 RepID=A0A516X3T7_9ACTN|nr:D-alanine--D-alanine ligase family protein [Tomitella fengzijianii]QDQ97730.1 D-alanine--D-alanine ligase [Tomitella fengzijianii]
MNNRRTRVAVVYGGRSSEHSVSCVSAGSVLAHLDRDRFEPVAVGITEEGRWVLGPDCADGAEGPAAELAPDGRRLPVVDGTRTPVALSADPTRAGALLSLADGAAGDVLREVDVVFPVLHGPFGEDGTIQGLLELAGVPYVGPGVLASAAGMDKEFTKKLLAADGLPVGTQVVLRRGEDDLTASQRERLGLPVFVKPARGGSSIGITRVGSWDGFPAALAEARRHDPKVIVEAAIVGREVECGVLERADGTVSASMLAEIRMPEADDDAAGSDGGAFYDFDTKYLDDVCEFDIPAEFDDAVADEVRAMAVRAFRALDCQGLARVDFFVTAEGPVINEINTMPGFTAISMYPKMWAAAGTGYADLLTEMVDTATARGTGLR